jgi:hypothetical protein
MLGTTSCEKRLATTPGRENPQMSITSLTYTVIYIQKGRKSGRIEVYKKPTILPNT